MSRFSTHSKGLFAPLNDHTSKKNERIIMLTRQDASRRHRLGRPVLATVYSLISIVGMTRAQQVLVRSPFKAVSYIQDTAGYLGEGNE